MCEVARRRGIYANIYQEVISSRDPSSTLVKLTAGAICLALPFLSIYHSIRLCFLVHKMYLV